MTVSISVHAGLVAHTIPLTASPAVTSSPRIAGGDELAGKKAEESLAIASGLFRAARFGRRRRAAHRRARAPLEQSAAASPRSLLEPSSRALDNSPGTTVVSDPVDGPVAVVLEVFGGHEERFHAGHLTIL